MKLWKIANGKIHLSMSRHEGQAKAWRSNRRFIFMLAGTQGGKTSFLPWWLAREITRCGSGDYIAATSSYDLFKLKFLPEMREVFERLLGIGRYWAGDKVIELRNPGTGKFEATRSDDPMWGRIILRSAQSKSGLESATAKAAILDEVGQDDWALSDWEAILRRLSISQGRVCGATTLYNLGWLKSEIYEPWLDGDKDIDVIQFRSTINPAFPKEEFERAKKRMQDWRFKMFYEGEFTTPAHLIYGSFDDLLIDDFDIPDDWSRVIGLDFGGANTASLHAAENPSTKEWVVYKETLSGGKATSVHVEEQKKLIGNALEYEVVGGASGETQQRMDWSDAGLFVDEPIISDVEAGIDRVIQLKPRLKIFRSLRGLRDESGRYQRKIDALGNPTDEILNKRHFHRLDCLRGMAIHILEGSGVSVYVGGEKVV